jgi:formylglycine-generating enzyme required for sulfatase activity
VPHAAWNHDPLPYPAGITVTPVLPVTLAPFFLSKYEMTQGQWQRTTASNPSKDNPRDYHRTWNARRQGGNLLHPVEDVEWLLCTETLRWLDLSLPTEAQWEYAARAGTRTAWWTGEDPLSLDGAANIADRYAEANGGDDFDTETWLDDGHTSHAPVGSFRANGFGLHDVAGNVAEWCRDAYEDYGRERQPGDGEVLVEHPRYRIVRGGHFLARAPAARSAARASEAPDTQNVVFGLRPAREVRE